MSNTAKATTSKDYEQTIKRAFNDVDATMTTNGYLVGDVGRKVVQVISETTVPGDTFTFNFTENGVPLYSIKVIYTDDTRATMLSAERIA